MARKHKRRPSTSLYVKDQGEFIETGFTQERFDRLVKENDKMLMLLDDFRTNSTDFKARMVIERFLESRQDDLVAARSRTKP